MSDQPTLFPMGPYRKQDRKKPQNSFSFDPEILTRRQKLVYCLQLLLPVFLFGGVLCSDKFRAMEPVPRNQLFFSLLIGITLLEVALILTSRIMLRNMASIRIRVAGTIKRIDGRHTKIISFKDIARVIVRQLPSGTTHSIQIRSFAGVVTLWGLKDMDALREAIEKRIPDRRGRVQTRAMKFDFDRLWVTLTLTIAIAVIVMAAKAWINTLSSGLGSFVVMAIGVGLIAKSQFRPTHRWTLEIETLSGGLLAAAGLILVLFELLA